MLVYPGSPHDGHANDVFGAHVSHWFGGNARDGIVITLTDPWVIWPETARRLPLAAWTPVDHLPLMHQTKKWYEKTDAIPIAMSRFGEKVLQDADLAPVYVPHGFDSEIFYPRARTASRAETGFPRDAFIVGIVAANKGVPSRKGFAQMLAAYKIFSERHPGESILYIHTHVASPDGEDLVAMCEQLKIRPRMVHQYYYALGIDPSSLANVMSSFDVLMNLAHGEGFGVPIVEAMACGVPAIVTDFSSMPEIVGDTGWRVEGQAEWTPFRAWQSCPDVEAAVAALEEAYAESAEERATRRLRVIEKASEYEADSVTKTYWAPAMDEIEDRLYWRSERGQFKEV